MPSFEQFAGVDFDAPVAPGWIGRADGLEDLDLDDLSNNVVPPTPLGELCCVDAGDWLIRAYTALSVDCTCPADLEGDGSVGYGDLLRLLATWGPCAECPGDLDGSGDVGFGDFTMLIAQWGECSP